MGLLDGMGGGGGLLGISPQALGMAMMANSGPSRMPHGLLSDFGQAGAGAQQMQSQQYQNALQQFQLPMMAQRFQLMQDAMNGTGAFAGGQGGPSQQEASQAALSQGGGPTTQNAASMNAMLNGNGQSSSDTLRRAMILEQLIPGAGKAMLEKNTPGFQNLREGSALFDPTGRIVAQNPRAPQNTILNQGPGGQYSVSPLPGALPAQTANEAIPFNLENLYKFGIGVPGEGGTASAPTPTGLPGAPTSLPKKQDIPTAQGTLLPSIKQAAPISNATEYLKSRIPQWAETENEWGKAIPSNIIAEQRGLAIADALKRTQSGQWATEKADVAASLHAVGIDLPTDILGDPAQVQRALKDNFAQTLATIKQFSNRPAAAEVILGQKNYSNPNLQPEANLSIISETVGQMRWERALMNDWAQAKTMGWRDPQDFQRAWTKANPLQGFIDKTKAEIGPLKGMPGGPGSPSPIDPDAARKELIRRGLIQQ